MSAWWLILIVPLSMASGLALGGLLGAAKRADQISEAVVRAMEKKPPEAAVTVRARRDIPEDVWMEKIMTTDAKTAKAWLQLSMAQQLASETAPHVAVGYVFDNKTRTYKIFADLQVVPLEARNKRG